MRISLFHNAWDNSPKVIDITWTELSVELIKHQPVEHYDKRHVQTWSPTEYDAGTKGNSAALRNHAGVLDFDELSIEQFAKVLEVAKPYAYILYSSFSHGWKKTGYSFRLILRLSRPVEKYEWDTFWSALFGMFDSLADTNCSDLGRVYFGPSYPLTSAADPFSDAHEGEPLDVDSLLTGGARRRLVADDLHALAVEVKAKRPDLAKALVALIKGEPYAPPGERDTTIFRVCGALVRKYPDLDIESTVGWFARSTAAMASVNSDTPTLDVVREKLTRQLDEHGGAGLTGGDRIGQALGNSGRKHPYSESELDAICAELGCDRTQLTYRWVLQKSGSYYLLVNGEYRGPYSKEDVVAAASRDLSPASSAGVELVVVSKDGAQAPKSSQMLVLQYGEVLDQVIIDMTAKKTRYDAVTRTLYEAGSPLRDLTPAYDAQVNEWIGLLAKNKAHQLNSWLAALTWLDRPAVAVFLTGAGGAGKSLFAEGCARLWTTNQATTLASVMSQFNDGFTQCPLCFADESLPTYYNGKNRTEDIRQFIQARTRPLARKYLPLATALGAARLVIAANNDQILKLSADLNENDIKAITDRFLHIPVGERAVDFLKSLSDGGSSFVTEDRLARHSLWLRDNYEWVPSGRFLISASDDELYKNLVNTVGLRSQVLGWIVAWLMSGDSHIPDVRIIDGEVYITSSTIEQNWTTFSKNLRVPDVGLLGKVLRNLSTRQVKQPGKRGRYNRYHVIDSKHLRSWASSTDAVLVEEIDNQLARNRGA